MPPLVPKHIILARTDGIGDVVLTLPMAGLLRERFPGARITFLGSRYTLPVLRRCRHVDHAIALEELAEHGPEEAVRALNALQADTIVHVFPQRRLARWARQAGIPHRIGTSHRWWNWTSCNHRVSFSRRKSGLHEAQLNLKLLGPMSIADTPSLDELAALSGFSPRGPDDAARALLRPNRLNVVLHPLSKGSAAEWGLDRFAALIEKLDPARFHAIVTGTAVEAERYRSGLPLHLPHVTDAGGRLSLDQFIGLIGASDALVAASTGPLHIAAACGIRAIGLYSPKRPIHPGRWAPIGRDTHALVAEGVDPQGDPKEHLRAIAPERVLDLLEQPFH